MKHNPAINTIQAFWPKPSAMAAAILLLTASAFQGFSQSAPPPLLQMTENSSTSLTVLWDGSSAGVTVVLNGSSDNWTVTLPVAVNMNVSDGSGGRAIPEPPAVGFPGPWNNVTTLPGGAFVNTVEVVSDSTTTFPTATVIANNAVGSGGVLATGAPFDLQFNDLGDGTTR